MLDLVRKKLAADQIVLSVGYDHTGIPENYQGELNLDATGNAFPRRLTALSISESTPPPPVLSWKKSRHSTTALWMRNCWCGA